MRSIATSIQSNFSLNSSASLDASEEEEEEDFEELDEEEEDEEEETLVLLPKLGLPLPEPELP